jgi:hypothetical protein
MIICNRSLCYDFRYLSLCFPLHRWIDVILWCTRFMLWGIYHMLALRHIVVPLWRSVYILTDYELCKCFVFKKKKKKKKKGGGRHNPWHQNLKKQENYNISTVKNKEKRCHKRMRTQLLLSPLINRNSHFASRKWKAPSIGHRFFHTCRSNKSPRSQNNLGIKSNSVPSTSIFINTNKQRLTIPSSLSISYKVACMWHSIL